MSDVKEDALQVCCFCPELLDNFDAAVHVSCLSRKWLSAVVSIKFAQDLLERVHLDVQIEIARLALCDYRQVVGACNVIRIVWPYGNNLVAIHGLPFPDKVVGAGKALKICIHIQFDFVIQGFSVSVFCVYSDAGASRDRKADDTWNCVLHDLHRYVNAIIQARRFSKGSLQHCVDASCRFLHVTVHTHCQIHGNKNACLHASMATCSPAVCLDCDIWIACTS